jgi:hypothetical protein
MVYLNSLMWGLGCFTAVFFAHLMLWRYGRIQREILWLFIIFLLFPVITALFLILFGISAEEVLVTLLLFLVVAASYIQTYPALKEDIPSFLILLYVHDAEQRGSSWIDSEDIVAELGATGLVTLKLDELHGDRLLLEHQGRVKLTPSGRMLALFFYYYRRLLGLTQGKG